MCESSAYMIKNGEETLLLSEVSVMRPVEDGYMIGGLFGDEMHVKGKLKELNLIAHKIVFEEDG